MNASRTVTSAGKKAYLVRTNQVAPIIIKNCKEEFQQVNDFKEPIVYGRAADGMIEHPLIKVCGKWRGHTRKLQVGTRGNPNT